MLAEKEKARATTRAQKGKDMKQERQQKIYRNGAHKSNLKIVAAGAGKPKHLRAGGLEPSDSMGPDQYVAGCEGGTITTKGKKTIAVLEFRIVDGTHSGTA